MLHFTRINHIGGKMKKAYFVDKRIHMLGKIILSCIIFVLAAQLTYNFIINVSLINSWQMALMALFTGYCAFSIWGWGWFTFRSALTKIIITDHNISLSRLGKVVTDISWEQVKELGIGMFHYTPGNKHRLYISETHLDDELRKHLNRIRFDCIMLPYVSKDVYEGLRDLCPFHISDEVTKISGSNLRSLYRA